MTFVLKAAGAVEKAAAVTRHDACGYTAHPHISLRRTSLLCPMMLHVLSLLRTSTNVQHHSDVWQIHHAITLHVLSSLWAYPNVQSYSDDRNIHLAT